MSLDGNKGHFIATISHVITSLTSLPTVPPRLPFVMLTINPSFAIIHYAYIYITRLNETYLSSIKNQSMKNLLSTADSYYHLI